MISNSSIGNRSNQVFQTQQSNQVRSPEIQNQYDLLVAEAHLANECFSLLQKKLFMVTPEAIPSNIGDTLGIASERLVTPLGAQLQSARSLLEELRRNIERLTAEIEL